MTGMSLVVCPCPDRCGVQSHVCGSDAEVACRNRSLAGSFDASAVHELDVSEHPVSVRSAGVSREMIAPGGTFRSTIVDGSVTCNELLNVDGDVVAVSWWQDGVPVNGPDLAAHSYVVIGDVETYVWTGGDVDASFLAWDGNPLAVPDRACGVAFMRHNRRTGIREVVRMRGGVQFADGGESRRVTDGGAVVRGESTDELGRLHSTVYRGAAEPALRGVHGDVWYEHGQVVVPCPHPKACGVEVGHIPGSDGWAKCETVGMEHGLGRKEAHFENMDNAANISNWASLRGIVAHYGADLTRGAIARNKYISDGWKRELLGDPPSECDPYDPWTFQMSGMGRICEEFGIPTRANTEFVADETSRNVLLSPNLPFDWWWRSGAANNRDVLKVLLERGDVPESVRGSLTWFLNSPENYFGSEPF